MSTFQSKRRRLLGALSAFVMAGCATKQPQPETFHSIYYAEQEEPRDQFAYKVYLSFKDDQHFTFWRTNQNPAEVLARLNYYLKEHPGSDTPAKYKRLGDSLTGMRELSLSTSEDERSIQRQRFTGQFSGESLEIRQEVWTISADGQEGEKYLSVWNMHQIGLSK